MARRSGLGRGPGGPHPDRRGPVLGGRSTRSSRWPASSPTPTSPGRHFDEEALGALTASIREVGVLQPILVRPLDGGQFQLIAGERRWRAGQRAGLRHHPGDRPRRPTTSPSLEQALVENLHRQDLNALEEAAGLPAADRGLRAHPRRCRPPGRQEPGRRSPTPCACCQLPPVHPAPGGRRPADRRPRPGPARQRRPQPSRSRWPGEAVAEGWSVRTVEEVVREGADEPPGDEQDRAGTAGARAPSSVRRACSSSRSCSRTYLDTRVRGLDGRRSGARWSSSSPRSRISSGSTAWSPSRRHPTERPRAGADGGEAGARHGDRPA